MSEYYSWYYNQCFSCVHPQWTSGPRSCRSTGPCWSPLGVWPRCPPACCGWRTPTAPLSGWSSSWSGSPPTAGWSCSERRERGPAGTWTGTTPSPGRSWGPAGSGSDTRRTKPGQWVLLFNTKLIICLFTTLLYYYVFFSSKRSCFSFSC